MPSILLCDPAQLQAVHPLQFHRQLLLIFPPERLSALHKSLLLFQDMLGTALRIRTMLQNCLHPCCRTCNSRAYKSVVNT